MQSEFTVCCWIQPHAGVVTALEGLSDNLGHSTVPATGGCQQHAAQLHGLHKPAPKLATARQLTFSTHIMQLASTEGVVSSP